MEKNRKNLKDYSYLILFLTGLTALRMIFNLIFNGLGIEAIPADMNLSKEILQVIAIIGHCVGFAFLLPSIYVGVKGLKIAKNPDDSKAHIIWAKILLVFAVIATISAVSTLFSTKDVMMGIVTVIDAVLDIIAYFFFIKYATDVKKAL